MSFANAQRHLSPRPARTIPPPAKNSTKVGRLRVLTERLSALLRWADFERVSCISDPKTVRVPPLCRSALLRAVNSAHDCVARKSSVVAQAQFALTANRDLSGASYDWPETP